MDHSIFRVLQEARDPKKAVEMAAYMKNLFPFLGIAKPQRAALTKEFIKAKKEEDGVDWAFVFDCYRKEEREYQYLAIDYLLNVKNRLTPNDLDSIEALIVTKSWWDTVDAIDNLPAEIYRNYPEVEKRILRWANSESIWLRRTAIDFQLQYKDRTNKELLAAIIEANLGSSEFFVNKAIGWALREYSKTNRDWVAEFVSSHPLSKLSVREAGKYL